MNKKIILVEDDSAIVDIYQTIMSKNNFDVETISLGRDVLKKIKEINDGVSAMPDLMLLDLILPDMNGIEILTHIRNTPATKDLKVFILTNQEEVQKQLPAEIKPDKIMIKADITPTDLVKVISESLG